VVAQATPALRRSIWFEFSNKIILIDLRLRHGRGSAPIVWRDGA